MFKNLAWENFLKTGNLETYMEYRKLTKIDENELDMGDNYSELDKSKGYSDKGDNI